MCSNAIGRSLGNFPFCSSPSLLLPSGLFLFYFSSADVLPPPLPHWPEWISSLLRFSTPMSLDRYKGRQWSSTKVSNPDRYERGDLLLSKARRLMFINLHRQSYFFLFFWLYKVNVKTKPPFAAKWRSCSIGAKLMLLFWSEHCGSYHWNLSSIWYSWSTSGYLLIICRVTCFCWIYYVV